MARDEQDKALLEQISTSVLAIRELQVSEATRPWRNSALALLESAYAEFMAMVEQEHKEEYEAHDAMAQMQQARDGLDGLFVRVIAALDIAAGQLQLSPDATSQAQTDLNHFLNRFHAGEFESLRDLSAIDTIREACGFLALSGDATLNQQLSERADAIISQLKLARMSAVSEGSEAIDAYGDLVEGRSIARVCYLTARDLLSAALRFEERHHELDGFIPPMNDVITVGISF